MSFVNDHVDNEDLNITLFAANDSNINLFGESQKIDFTEGVQKRGKSARASKTPARAKIEKSAKPKTQKDQTMLKMK